MKQTYLKIAFGLASLLCFIQLHAEKSLATIYCKMAKGVKLKEVVITIYKYGSYLKEPLFQRQFHCKPVNGSFTLKIPLDLETEYANINYDFPNANKKDLIGISIRNKDELNIFCMDDTVEYKGNCAERIKVIRKLKDIHSETFKQDVLNFYDTANLLNHFKLLDCSLRESLRYLGSNKVKGILTPREINELMSDLKLSTESAKIIAWYYGPFKWSDSIAKRPYMDLWNKYRSQDTRLNQKENIAWRKSRFYAKYIIYKFWFDSSFALNQPFNIKDCYIHLKKNYSGYLRERLVSQLLEDNWRIADTALYYILNDALSYFGNTDFREIMNKYSKLRGSIPFYFKMLDYYGNYKTLNDFKGKVILLDFWFTGCGNCATAHPYLEQIKNRLDTNFVIISICTDKDAETWKASVNKGLYTNVNDINLITNNLGVDYPLIKFYNIRDYPFFMLIDKKGLLAEVPPDPRPDEGISLEALIRKELAK